MNTPQYNFTVEYLKLSREPSDINHETIEKYRKIWWYNIRYKSVGGLRLTNAGLKYITKYNVEKYIIDFYEPLKISSQVLITLDNLIDCPYYITSESIVVTSHDQCANFALYGNAVDVYINSLTKSLNKRRLNNENQAALGSKT